MFGEWIEEFDNECFVAFSVDNSYTSLNVLFNGDVYYLGNGGSLFYNFSVPYNTLVTFGYWNNYYTFESWAGVETDWSITEEVDYAISSTENIDDYENNPAIFSCAYYDSDYYVMRVSIYPVSVYNGNPTPTPTATATLSPTVAPTATPSPYSLLGIDWSYMIEVVIAGILMFIAVAILMKAPYAWIAGVICFIAAFALNLIANSGLMGLFFNGFELLLFPIFLWGGSKTVSSGEK